MSEAKCAFVGRVVAVLPTETLGKDPAKPFYKRVIVVDDTEIGSKYANPVPFEATGEKCQYLDQYNVGDIVRIEFYPNGRAWDDPKTKKTRYFPSNRIGYIAKDGAEDAGAGGAADAGADGDGVADDMPF